MGVMMADPDARARPGLPWPDRAREGCARREGGLWAGALPVLGHIYAPDRGAVHRRSRRYAPPSMGAWVAAAVLAVVAAGVGVRLLVVARRAQGRPARKPPPRRPTQRERIAALERAADDLRASEQAYRALVEAAPDWMWACDPDGTLTFSNPAGAALLGDDDLVGQPLADLTHPEDRPALRADGWSGVVRRRYSRRHLAHGGDELDPGPRRRGQARRLARDRPRPHAHRAGRVRAAGAPGRGDRALAGGGRPARRRRRTSWWATAACSTATRRRAARAGRRPADLAGGAAGRASPSCRPTRPCSSSRPGTDPERARALAKAGFQLAVDDYEGDQALLAFVGVVKVRAPGREDEELQALIAEPAARGLELVATGVGSPDELTRCRVLGFTHFQGEFFARPRGGKGGAAGRVRLAARAGRADRRRQLVRGHRAGDRRRRRALARPAALRQLGLLRAPAADRHRARGADAARARAPCAAGRR